MTFLGQEAQDHAVRKELLDLPHIGMIAGGNTIPLKGDLSTAAKTLKPLANGVASWHQRFGGEPRGLTSPGTEQEPVRH